MRNVVGRIKADYFIEVYQINQSVYNGNCYPIISIDDILQETKKDDKFKTIAIFKIKLKNT